jgi:hypothetical protein
VRRTAAWKDICARLVACGVVAIACVPAIAAAEALPDGRSYEMVSPVDKNGGNLVPDTQRVRASDDGDAVSFVSLAAFGDVVGTGIGTDYLSVRAHHGAVDPRNGWMTHAITPPQSGTTYDGILAVLEPRYVGEFSPDLARGVVFAQSPVTDDASTANVANLYLRSDLREPGPGFYDLLTGCPLCQTLGRGLPGPRNPAEAVATVPTFAGMSPDGGVAAFESVQRLTADTPLAANRAQLFAWDHGSVRLVGRVPRPGDNECDDASGPACVPSGVSIAGKGAGATHGKYRVPHVVSDGSDGHSRVFFTAPTQSDGVTLDPTGEIGQLYMRLDEHATVHLNVSERGVAPESSRPAAYLDASADGERVFFISQQALTDDATGTWKLYMYDASKPGSAADNLTFLSADGEPADGTGGSVSGMIGASASGNYVYFLAEGQLVGGQPLGVGRSIYLWHDGALQYVGPAAGGILGDELFGTGVAFTLTLRQARGTPDGRHLLFSAWSGSGLGGYDHGTCEGGRCRELYIYTADDGTVACVSCNPTGDPATANATDAVRTQNGGTQTDWHENEAITDDGARVFFSTAEALVPADINGKSDAYEYDVATRSVHLLSSGRSSGDSWFMDASKSGDDAFFLTREPLVGWDRDQAYDLYDARVSGGWPEPPSEASPCGDADRCRGPATSAPGTPPSASASFRGSGDVPGTLQPRPARCRAGTVKRTVRGKVRCAKKPKRRHRTKRVHAGTGRGRA